MLICMFYYYHYHYHYYYYNAEITKTNGMYRTLHGYRDVTDLFSKWSARKFVYEQM